MRAQDFLTQIAEMTGDPETRCTSEMGRHMYFWRHEGRDYMGCIDLAGVQGAGEPWAEAYIEAYLTYVRNRIADEVRVPDVICRAPQGRSPCTTEKEEKE